MVTPVLLVIVVAVVIVMVVRGVTRNSMAHEQKVDDLASDRTATLTYRPTPGQDPVYVVTALERAGFRASNTPTDNKVSVVVECPNGIDADRERIREVLRDASSTGFEGKPIEERTVRFVDEEADA